MLSSPRKKSYEAPAAIAFDSIWAFSSGEHFKVNPQRLQRIKWFPPSGITGMKNSVNHRFDSIAVNMVGREHFEQGYWIWRMGVVFVRTPKRKNILKPHFLGSRDEL